MIKTFSVKGERCSGTTYLQKLIETNFQISYRQHTAWKHGYYNHIFKPDFFLSQHLTLIIFRNIYDWVRSLYLAPHHLYGAVDGQWIYEKKPSFSEFLRHEIIQVDNFNEEITAERHPLYLTRPKNILELRKWKIEHFLSLDKLLEHTFFTTYESLLTKPDEVLEIINKKWFNINLEFKNWSAYKEEKNIEYKQQLYFDISDEDTTFIKENTDWTLEKKLGYEI